MDERLLDFVLQHLGEARLDSKTEDLVLAACSGDAELAAALGGSSLPRPDLLQAEAAESVEPAGAYLAALTVEGFRGVGEPATLELQPGPGLTLVVGRNGSGKSSFAEAFEFLLTKKNARWEGRSKVWTGGWRNLHHATASITAELVEQGQAGPTKVVARWASATSDLEGADVTVTRTGSPTASVSSLGWDAPLQMWRPFLPYSELGSMLDEGPSKLYDTLSKILGLDDLIEAESRLRAARLTKDKQAKALAAEKKQLVTTIQGAADSRAATAVALLVESAPDLDQLETLATGEGSEAASDLAPIRAVLSVRPPDPSAAADAAEELRVASTAAAAVAATDAGRALTLAQLLTQAVEHRRSHEDRTCPVCRQGVLDDTWEQTAQAQIAELQQAAAAASQAKTRLDQAMRKASTFISPVPDGLLVGSHAGLGSIEPAVVAWASLGDAPDDPVLLADHLDQYVPQVAASMAPVHDEAQRELDRRQDLWRPVAAALAAWVTRARDGQSAADDVNRLKKAEDWLKAAAAAIRDDRFGPIAERSRQIWSQLRQQSNVDLGRVALAGASTQRRVELAVTIDGVEGAALGVMSQGELHALALSLFLPRATMPESPFRFVIVDDPVQAMDPARVDGLARVLSDVAKTRQVIVFTHDDRLPEAIRQLQLPGRVVEVTRRAGSVIELREGLTPAKRAIDDAMALAQSHRAGEVPLEVARRVIPGFCRVAVEAACADVVRRRRLRRGDDHASVESVLEASANLTRRLILAIWDQEDNRPNVSDEITARFGKSKAETYKLLNKGAHQGLEGDDFVGLVRNSEQFVGQLLELS